MAKIIIPFKIEISGDSGNCSINRREEQHIKEQISNVLKERNINVKEIRMWC